jgi:hypothetical protein
MPTILCPGCNEHRLVPRKRNKFCSSTCANRTHAKGVRVEAPAPTAEPDGVTFAGDNCTIRKTAPLLVRTEAEAVKACAVDLDTWEVVACEIKAYQQASVPRVVGRTGNWSRKSDKPVVTQLYSIHLKLRKRVALIAARAEIEALIRDSRKRIAPAPAVRLVHTPSGNMLEINITDLHVGKLAWGPETGHENYDARLAERVHDAAVEALVARTAGFKIERILLIVGNDLLHADTKAGTTTGGTPLDMDSRYHRSFLIVRKMIVRCIFRLREIAPVKVVTVPGNHDTLSTWHLGDSLEMRFHDAKHVDIDNVPGRMRAYEEWGRVMLMFTHGNRGKLDRYPQLMARERPEMWGRTEFREAHTGDKHQAKTIELFGCRVRILPALCPPDAWHSENLFVGNLRQAEAFVWNKAEGMVGTALYTIPAGKAAA